VNTGETNFHDVIISREAALLLWGVYPIR